MSLKELFSQILTFLFLITTESYGLWKPINLDDKIERSDVIALIEVGDSSESELFAKARIIAYVKNIYKIGCGEILIRHASSTLSEISGRDPVFKKGFYLIFLKKKSDTLKYWVTLQSALDAYAVDKGRVLRWQHPNKDKQVGDIDLVQVLSIISSKLIETEQQENQ